MSSIGAEIASAYVTVYAKMPGVSDSIAKQLGGAATRRAVSREGDAIGATLGGAISKGFSKAKSFVPDLMAGFNDARAAASAFTGVGANIGAALSKGVRPAVSAVQNFVSGFNDSKAAASSFTGVLGTIGGAFGKALSPVTTQVKLFKGGFNDARAAASSFSGVAGTLGGVAAKAWGSISSGASSMGASIGKVWSGIQSGASTAFESVRNAALSLTDQLGGAFDKAMLGAGALLTTFGGIAAVKGWDRLVTIEDSTAALGITMGDAAKAGALLDDVMNVVTGTGYNFDQFASAASTLAGFGVSGEKIPGYLTAIGEAAATKGKRANEFAERLTTQFGQMAAVGQVSMTDIWRLADVGVDGLTILGNHFGVVTSDMKKMISEGSVPAAEAMDVLSAGIMNGSEGAAGSTKALAGTMEALRGTTSGVVGGMWSAFSRFGAGALEPLMPVIKDLTTSFTGWLNDAGPKVASFLGDLVGWVSANKDWLTPVVVGLGAFAGVVGTIIGVTKAWRAAQAALNIVLALNPIGAIVAAIAALVAGLVFFFTQTETGKKIWGEFTRFLGEAWANISGFFIAAYENVIKPVFDGIAAVATWVFENILRPAFLGAQIHFAILGGIIAGVWESILKPVFDGIAAVAIWLWQTVLRPTFEAIGAIFQWIWGNVVSPVIGWIQQKLQLWGLATQIVWQTYIKPALDAVGAAFQWIWNTIISPVVDWIKGKLDLMGLAFRIAYEQYIRPAWDAVSSKVQAGWQVVKGVIDTLSKVVKTDPKLAFEAARDAIGTAWAGIQELAKKPVRFVIETVINGLINTVNKLPGVNIPTVPMPKGFARGGILPGMSRMSDGDDQLIMARRGEGMMVSEALRTSADRSAFLAANAAGRKGIGFASMMQGLARGGLVDPLPQGSWTVSQPYHAGHNGIDLAAASGTKIMAAGRGVVGLASSVPMGGNEIYIQHPNGLGTRYSHLSAFSTSVGATVRPGQKIGEVGSTGMSTGPHLHYMVHSPGGGGGNYGNHVNPASYMGVSGEAWSILDGLVDWATNAFKSAFPASDLWVDIAGGLMKDAVRQAVAGISGGFGTDDMGTTLYDSGGWLPTGTSLVENRSGRPEPILTASQWDDLLGGRGNTGPYEVKQENHFYEVEADPRLMLRQAGREMKGALLP